MNTSNRRETFISYSRKDKEFALKLARELKSAGYLVWLDQLDIPTGARWDDEVEKALRECDIFLIILTPASVSSENVKDEMGYAIDHRKRIMPILLEECLIPLRLRRFQYINFTDIEFGVGIKSVKHLLDSLLNESSIPTVKISPEVEAQKADYVDVTEIPQRDQIVSRPSLGNLTGSTVDAEIVRSMIPFSWTTIPAGYFPIGSDKEQDRYASDIEKKHTLYLPEYHIASIPVTVAQFRHFVAATHYRTTAEKQGWAADWTGATWRPKEGAYWEHPHGSNSDVRENHPVTCISWYDAIEFCKWAVVRLPTEAEWEKAAGYDSNSQTKYIYPWGDELPDNTRCNFNLQVGDTTAIDRYPPGANGMYGMAGNVWEWTSSLYKEYPYEADDRENLQALGERVLRGGSWYQEARYIRCAHRHWHTQDATVSDIGFRVCAVKRSE